jgi:hypothetical protein
MSPDEPEKRPDSQSERNDLFSLFQEHWREILQGLILVAVLLSVFRGLARTLVDAQVPVAAKHRVESGNKSTDLQIIGWIERDQVSFASPLHVHYSFINPSAVPIHLQLVLFEAPGFSGPAYLRPRLSGYPLYWDSAKTPVPSQGASLMVPAGGTSDARVEIVPFERTGSSMVTGLFQWQDASGTQRHEALDLGPIRLTSTGLLFFSNALDTGTSLAQTVALPLLIALAGLALQQVHQRFVNDRQAWVSMLPISHENNLTLYIPFVSGISTFRQHFEAFLKGPQGNTEVYEETTDVALFFLLFCFRRFREMEKGFYLADRDGEDLLTDLWDRFRDSAVARLSPYESLSTLLDTMSANESFSRYRRKIAKAGLSNQFGKMRKAFEDWSKTPTDFDLLFLLFRLLGFEVNRIYTFWYGSPPEFPDCAALLENLQASHPDLVQRVRDYREAYAKKEPTTRRIRKVAAVE